MSLNRKTVRNTLLTLAFVLLPQFAAAQTNTFPSSGNVGVGTTAPATKLEVKDTSSFQVTPNQAGTGEFSTSVLINSAGAGLTLLPDGNGTVGPKLFLGYRDAAISMWRSALEIANTAGYGNLLLMKSGGNVGIGTTNPLGRFHMVAPSYTDTSIPVWDNRFLVVGADSNTGGISLSYNQTTNTGYLMSLSPNVAWRNTVIQPFAGNVGIGTTTPGFGGITSATYLTLASSGSNRPAFEFVSNLSDGVGKEAGFLDFVFNTNSAGHKRIGNISVDTEGAAANQRGGVMRLFTKPNASATMLERMRIDSAGNVGIGTTAPGYKLDVAGEIRSSSGGFRFPDGTVQTTAATGGGGGSQWTTSGANIYYNSGNVGIGTGSPGARLHVSAGDSSFALFGPNTTWGGSLAVGSGNSFLTPISGRAQVLSSNGNLHLDAGTNQFVYIGWLNPSTTIINAQGGNVGIGTATPSDLLEVNSTVGWGIRVRYQGNGNYLRVSDNQISSFTSAGAGRDLYLNTAGGNIGIGTITPSATLHVQGTGRFTGNVTVDGNINAKYQDLAEWVPSAEQLSAGTVVVLDTTKPNQVISSTVGYDTRIAGVISAQPGITLGEGGEGKVLVATTGRVRVKVDASRGPINIGDLLVTSDITGVAMRSEAVNLGGVQIHRPGTIIGKALEPQAKGQGEILVLLSLQ